jgi:hypothetical protein
MTKWLMRQESCHHFANYLQWTVPGYYAELTTVSETQADEDDGDSDDDDELDDPDQAHNLGYSVAKEPAYPQTPIASLVTDFGVSDFISNLKSFLRVSPFTSRSAFTPTPNTRLAVFKCLTVEIPPAPQVTKFETKDVIRARQAVPAHGITPSVAGQFDTVLARESDSDEELEHPLDGMSYPLAPCILAFVG